MMGKFIQSVRTGKNDVFIAVGMVGILIVLFTPIPAVFLDFLLIMNFSIGLLILLITFYTDKPLSFSTFPSILLIATLFRLALNVSATRLILNDADAGQVIGAIGSYVVGGNYVIGLVVFLILVVVQYVVVTNGAQRVAEVAARFTLDSMPGKQMSIDADMNMGVIDEKEAKMRRATIEKEANFYGAMDGATKFVKGDAIAGIVIILIDIIGGLSIGIVQHGLSWSESLQTYTLLTVGDGIVTQIPSLIIATATGIIITRAATDTQLGLELARQITSIPKTLVFVAIALLGIMFLPGLPVLPVFTLFIAFSLMAFLAYRNARVNDNNESSQSESDVVTDIKDDDDLYDLMRVDPLEIRVGKSLSSLLQQQDSTLLERLKIFRKQYALDYGFVIPEVRIRDDIKLDRCQYTLNIHGSKVANGDIVPEHFLAISPGGEQLKLKGIKTREPTYGLPAIWIDENEQKRARDAGYTIVDPETVLLTHFSEIVKRHASELLSRSETEQLILRMKDQQSGLIDELVPNIMGYSEIQKVFQLLLREKVSIRNVERILETLLDHGKHSKNIDLLTEKVRETLGTSICQALTDHEGELHLLTLEPDLERQFTQSIGPEDAGRQLVLDPASTNQFLTNLAAKCEAMMAQSKLPVMLCSPLLRRNVKDLSERIVPHLHVLSLNEIPTSAQIKAFGSVGSKPKASQ